MSRRRVNTSPRSDSEEEGLVGRRFAERYLVLSRVDTAGGRFYRALELATQRYATLMLLAPSAAIERLRGFQHPSVVALIDQGRLPSGRAYVLLDSFEGLTLADTLQRHGTPPIDFALNILASLAPAVDALGELGLGLAKLDASFVHLATGTAKLLPLTLEEHEGRAAVPRALAGLARQLLGEAHRDDVDRAIALARTSTGFANALRAAVATDAA